MFAGTIPQQTMLRNFHELTREFKIKETGELMMHYITSEWLGYGFENRQSWFDT
jgi:hypothetical protein